MYLIWINPANFNTITRYWYCSKIGFPWNFNYIQKKKQQIKSYIKSIGKSSSQLLIEAIQVIFFSLIYFKFIVFS